MRRVLVAASSGISASDWICRALSSSLPDADIELYQLGQNPILTKSINELNLKSRVLEWSGKERRSEINDALDNADHLLLFWDSRTLTQLLFHARLRGIPTKLFVIEVAEVVNKDRGDEFDVYIGRGSLWGNPFPVGKLEGQHERAESIEMYRAHFEKNILGDPSMRRGLLGLRGLRLACHCKPLACHGDVIAGYLNSLDPDSLNSEQLKRRARAASQETPAK